MMDNGTLCKGCQQEIECSYSRLFNSFFFGGGGGRQGNIKMKHHCELACSPRGILCFQMTGLIKLMGAKIKTQLSLNQELTTKKTHAKFPSPKNLQEEKKVWLHLIWLCFITSPPPPPPTPHPHSQSSLHCCRCFFWVGNFMTYLTLSRVGN